MLRSHLRHHVACSRSTLLLVQSIGSWRKPLPCPSACPCTASLASGPQPQPYPNACCSTHLQPGFLVPPHIPGHTPGPTHVLYPVSLNCGSLLAMPSSPTPAPLLSHPCPASPQTCPLLVAAWRWLPGRFTVPQPRLSPAGMVLVHLCMSRSGKVVSRDTGSFRRTFAQMEAQEGAAGRGACCWGFPEAWASC